MNNAVFEASSPVNGNAIEWEKLPVRTAVNHFGELLWKGTVVVVDNGERRTLGLGYGPGIRTEIHVHHPRFYARVAARGAAGAVESYCDGDWTCSDLSALLSLVMSDEALREKGLGAFQYVFGKPKARPSVWLS